MDLGRCGESPVCIFSVLMMAWMKDIAPKVLLRLAVGVLVFFVANIWYVSSGLRNEERLKFSPVAGKLDSAFLSGDVVYLGESSNTSFNPWTDTFGYSVSEFLQMYLPQNRVRGVSHDGYHVGLFSQMLGLMPAHWSDSSRKTVVITVNMRSFGPSAMFNGNEASNQQEAIFYSHRMALLNRVFVSLHHYDSRDAREMERAKTQWFRTKDLRLNGGAGNHYGNTHGDGRMVSKGEEFFYHNTVKWWLRDLQRQYAPEFMKQKLGTAEGAVAPFVSLYWASLMIGRWTSAAGVFDLSKSMKTVLGIVLPFVAFGIFAGANIIGGNDINELYPYLGIVVLLIVADYLSAGNPVKQIMIYSSLGAIAIAIGIFSSGMISVFAFISVGIFCSTLWPCIFTLSIAGMGENTNTASSLLIMMIMGGGFISVLQGALADDSVLGIQQSYWLGVACFAYLVFFAWSVSKILRNRGVDIFSSEKVAGH